MRAYSLDLRQRVLADCDAGHSNDVVARKFTVSASWIRRLKQRRRETGSIEPRQRQMPGPRLMAHADRLQHLVELKPDSTLEELREALGVQASLSSIWRELRRLRLTVKKKSFGRPNKTDPTWRRSGKHGGT
jgi:transposase